MHLDRTHCFQKGQKKKCFDEEEREEGRKERRRIKGRKESRKERRKGRREGRGKEKAREYFILFTLAVNPQMG